MRLEIGSQVFCFAASDSYVESDVVFYEQVSDTKSRIFSSSASFTNLNTLKLCSHTTKALAYDMKLSVYRYQTLKEDLIFEFKIR